MKEERNVVQEADEVKFEPRNEQAKGRRKASATC